MMSLHRSLNLLDLVRRRLGALGGRVAQANAIRGK